MQAGVRDNFEEELEVVLTKAFSRFATVDSRRLLQFWIDMLSGKNIAIGELENRMLQMFQFTVWQNRMKNVVLQAY